MNPTLTRYRSPAIYHTPGGQDHDQEDHGNWADGGPQDTREPPTKRFRPREMIKFGNPVTGPSGAQLIAYEWKWEPFVELDKRGEEVTRRISKWEEAVSSDETGREIVHQFHVRMPNGEVRLVSAESVYKVLGLTSSTAGDIKTKISSVRTLGRLKVEHSHVSDLLNRFKKDWSDVHRLTPPEITSDTIRQSVGREAGKPIPIFRMGDAQVVQWDGGTITSERHDTLVHAWWDNRIKEKGWRGGFEESTLGRRLTDIEKRIARAQEKIK